MDETLGTVLRRLRHDRNLTLEEVSEATGISVAMLSRAEREQRVPSTDVVAALSDYYGVPVEVLERYAAELHYRSRSNPRSGSRPSRTTLEAPSHGWAHAPSGEPPWFDAEHPPDARMGQVKAFRPEARGDDRSLRAAFSPFEPGPAESLTDIARIAEIALETAVRAAERARASGDPAAIAEAERVIARLQAILSPEAER